MSQVEAQAGGDASDGEGYSRRGILTRAMLGATVLLLAACQGGRDDDDDDDDDD